MLFDLFDVCEEQCPSGENLFAQEAVINGDGGYCASLLDGEDASLQDSSIDMAQDGLSDFVENSCNIMPCWEEGNGDVEAVIGKESIEVFHERPADIGMEEETDSSIVDSKIVQDSIAEINQLQDSSLGEVEEIHNSSGAAMDYEAQQNAQNASDVQGTGIPTPVFDLFEDIYDEIRELFSGDQDDLVRSSDFTDDGQFDRKNNLVVIGNPGRDAHYVEKQTNNSCSLMAQEALIHEYIGKPIPEDYLEWTADKWGVYKPEVGTLWEGQEMVLDHFDIPYQRYSGDLNDIVKEVLDGKNIIVGVDAREFYQNPELPPGSGHAVIVTGIGTDPNTHELKALYIADSNHPSTNRILSFDELNNCWSRDMIAVPEPPSFNA